MSQSEYSFKNYNLYVPSLSELVNLLSKKLCDHFLECEVVLIQCPDLRKAPFNLASEGLSGNESIADIGGVPYLIPNALTSKKPYCFVDIVSKLKMKEALIIGASLGPFHVTGTNCEYMPNLKVTLDEKTNECTVVNKSHTAKIESDNKYSCYGLDCKEINLLGNVFISEGKPGPVIKIKVKQRKSKENCFTTIIRNILKETYKENVVSLGGVFVIRSGKAKTHIMPDFSKKPLETVEDVNNWLKFFEMDSPLTCLTVFHSYDPGLDLRVEHTHCFSDHNQGGHYHYDTTPIEVEYEAYLNVARCIYRIDAPKVTHNVGRD